MDDRRRMLVITGSLPSDFPQGDKVVLGGFVISVVRTKDECLELIGSGRGGYQGIVINSGFPNAGEIATMCQCHASFRDTPVVVVDSEPDKWVDWFALGAILVIDSPEVTMADLELAIQQFVGRQALATR